MRNTILYFFLALIIIGGTCEIQSPPGSCEGCSGTVIRNIYHGDRLVHLDTHRVAALDTLVLIDSLELPPPDTLVVRDTVIVERRDTLIITIEDTVYQTVFDTLIAFEERTLYASTIDSTQKQYYDIHPALRGIDWQIIQDSLDDPNFRVLVYGKTSAERISFAAKCIGYDSTLTALPQTESLSLTPDSTGMVRGTTDPYGCHPPGGNASMNYWLTAITDSANYLERSYIDIAHIRSLPLNGN